MKTRLTPLAAAIALIGLAGGAVAQSDAGQRVEITGSSIKRIAAEGSLPVQVITRAELERDGITNAEQLIMMLSTNGNGLDNLASNADVVNGAARGNNGASSANLRGQGSAATLVLLNGRRVAAHGLNGGTVDVNQIPMAAVDRIEVLKDGASSIYGTDAIGGVINFILRKNFEGLRAGAYADVTEAGGGAIYKGHLVGGFGDLDKHGFNVLATLSYSDRQALRGDQRSFVNTFQPDRGLSVDTRGTPFATILPLGVGPNTPNGTIMNNAAAAPLVPGSTTVRASGGINVLDLPGGAGCGSIDGMAPYDHLLWDFAAAQFACAWDTGRAAVLQQPIQTTNLVLRGTARLGQHQLALDFTGSQAESAKRFSNLQLTPNTSTQNYAYPRNSTTAAVYDDIFNRLVAVFPSLEAQRGKPMSYRWRCIECGPREINTKTDTTRVSFAIDGPIGNWDYKAGLLQATSESQSTLGSGYYYRNTTRDAAGNVIANGIIDALNTGLINPFLFAGQTQTAAGLAALEAASARGVTLYSGKFTLQQADAAVSGPLFKLPGGEAMAAVGVDLRSEKYKFNGDARAASARPIIIAAPFDDGNALLGVKRDITAVFGELLMPVTKSLELTLSARQDDYTGFGSTTNPKASMRWRPAEQVLVRGSHSTGFRVPSFNQIFNAPSEAQYTGRDLVDPAKCPTGRVDTTKPGCELVTPIIVNGGKSDLGPEEAKMSSLGVIFEPNNRLSIALDWWHIERSNQLRILTLQQIVNNAALFPERFGRDANGTLLAIDQRWVNSGDTVTEGLEVSIKGGFDAAGARWLAGLDGTYLLKKKSRVLSNVEFGASEVGRYSLSGDLGLRWKHSAYLTYKRDVWSTTLSQTFRSGYYDQVLPGVSSGLITPPDWNPKVKSYTTYNLSLSYTGIKNLTVTGLVKNLLDQDPPFTVNYDSNLGSGSSWEPRVADPRGRAFAVTVEYKFF
jgi:iron complex outermembrane receptor protein